MLLGLVTASPFQYRRQKGKGPLSSQSLPPLPTVDRVREMFALYQPAAVDEGRVPLRPAGVLVPLYGDADSMGVVLHVRTSRVEHHKGEISFPGGGKDREDADLMRTALREAHEEMGILPEDVSILGQVDDQATHTGYLIRPFVGHIPADYPYTPSRYEVEKVLSIPVAHLVDPRNIGMTPAGPAFVYEQQIIFGATARILTQVLALILRAAWQQPQAAEPKPRLWTPNSPS
jgi:8-oxo-dGTP pyrophosphatase MutT (NUDIX family)